jgi:hypothetical protein
MHSAWSVPCVYMHACVLVAQPGAACLRVRNGGAASLPRTLDVTGRPYADKGPSYTHTYMTGRGGVYQIHPAMARADTPPCNDREAMLWSRVVVPGRPLNL